MKTHYRSSIYPSVLITDTAPTFTNLPVTLTYLDTDTPNSLITPAYTDVDTVDAAALTLTLDTTGGIGTLVGTGQF